MDILTVGMLFLCVIAGFFFVVPPLLDLLFLGFINNLWTRVFYHVHLAYVMDELTKMNRHRCRIFRQEVPNFPWHLTSKIILKNNNDKVWGLCSYVYIVVINIYSCYLYKCNTICTGEAARTSLLRVGVLLKYQNVVFGGVYWSFPP